MIKRIRVQDVGLLALAAVVTVLVAFAVRASLPFSGAPMPADQYPFSIVSEFPAETAEDRVTLAETASRFLSDIGWSPPEGGSPGWRWDCVDVLTVDGHRAGSYGLLLFEQAVDLNVHSGFVVCGVAWEFSREDGGFTSVKGLQVAVLDGRWEPYHILPVTGVEKFPQSGDLGWSGAEQCGQPARPS